MKTAVRQLLCGGLLVLSAAGGVQREVQPGEVSDMALLREAQKELGVKAR